MRHRQPARPTLADAADQEYLAFAARHRPLLRELAVLLTADVERADRLTESVLARRYPPQGSDAERLRVALGELIRPDPQLLDPPWRRGARLQLVDAGPRLLPPVLAALAELPPEQRAALVLRGHAGLPPAEVAAVLDTNTATAEAWFGQAVQRLTSDRPEWRQPGRLAAELAAAVHAGLAAAPPPTGPPDDLRHGRLLVRRRRLRSASALAAALLAVAALGVVGLRGAVREEQAGPSPGPVPVVRTPSPVPHVTAACDTTTPPCQATVLREWRAEMARVAAPYLDPAGHYFTGYSFSYDLRYEDPQFWHGGDGALGLELFRLQGGATEVYLQIASGYEHAVRCGQTTGHPCQSLRFLDGNRFSLTTSTEVSQGIEVQYRPDGDQVITVVARNTVRGRPLEVTRGELVALVQDPRLRLPQI